MNGLPVRGDLQAITYLSGYPESVIRQVNNLLVENRLGHLLRQKYPAPHDIRTDRALYDFTVSLKARHLRTAPPLSKVAYDGRIDLIHNALGLHTFVSRVQGGKLKAKNEIRVASLFREGPLPFLRMIVVHELAHLKEREHNKAFYQLCEHMEPNYHQLEFDVRLFLIHLELAGALYSSDPAFRP